MRSTSAVGAIAVLVALAGFALPARAAGPAEDTAFQTQVFGHPVSKDRAHACFRRVYDANHLAQHPQQNVRTMTLLVTGSSDDPDHPNYELGIGVTFRKSGTHFETNGDCGSIHDAGGKTNVVNCGVDCDGGAIDVTLKDAKSVLVSIPEGARIWKAGSDGDAPPPSERRRFGSDDKLFRLDRTALGDCLPLAGDDDKAGIRRGE